MRKQIFTVMLTILVLGIAAQSWGQEEDFRSKRNLLAADYEKWRQPSQIEQPLSSALADTNISLVNRMYYGPGQECVVKGNYAYVGAGDALLIFDVSNPDEPLLKAYTYTMGDIKNIQTSGNVVYVWHADWGIKAFGEVLEIFDVSDPVNPVKLGGFSTDLWAKDFTVDESGQYIYIILQNISSPQETFGIIDVSNPANPELIGNYVFQGHNLVMNFCSVGDYVYLIKYTIYDENKVSVKKDTLHVLDVSDHSNPTLAGEYSRDPWRINQLVADSNYVYLTTCSGNRDTTNFQILDFSDPASPVEISSIETNMDGSLSISDHHAYFVNYHYYSSEHTFEHTLQINAIDINDPAAPFEIGKYEYIVSDAIPFYGSFILENNIYFVGNDFNIIDFSDLNNIRKRGTCHIEDRIYDLAVFGDRIYMAQGVDGIKIMDATDPANPEEIGVYQTGDKAEEIQMLDKYFYFPEYEGGYISQFTLMDFSDPASPIELGPFKCKDRAIRIFPVGDTLYSALGFEGVGVYTLLKPDSLIEIARYASEKHVHDISVAGNFAYIVTTPTDRGYNYDDSLHVLDLSDLGDIKELGQCSCHAGKPIVRTGISVCGSRAYLPANSLSPDGPGFVTIDISDPYHPEEIGFYDVNSRKSMHIETWQNYVFIVGSKVLALDTSDPENFKQAGIFYLKEIFLSEGSLKGNLENFIYMTSNNGLFILKFDPPTDVVDLLPESNLPNDFSLQQNYPNPFNPSTLISYSLPGIGKHHVSLKIYNLLGQKVKTLVNSHQAAGVHCISWDGKDNSGQAVTSGIYFYQLKAGIFTQTKKMSFLR